MCAQSTAARIQDDPRRVLLPEKWTGRVWPPREHYQTQASFTVAFSLSLVKTLSEAALTAFGRQNVAPHFGG